MVGSDGLTRGAFERSPALRAAVLGVRCWRARRAAARASRRREAPIRNSVVSCSRIWSFEPRI
jgi:hypothetical protein